MAITIGFEIEIICYNYNMDIYNNRYFKKEYYDFHIEINNFKRTIRSVTQIEPTMKKAYEWANEKIEIFRPYAYGSFSAGSAPHIINDKTIIFNGVHMHFSYRNENNLIFYKENFSKLYKALINLHIEKRPLDPRFLFSHHIWGGLKVTNFSFKNKERYLPINYSENLDTIELRYLNFKDFTDLEYMCNLLELIITRSFDKNDEYFLNTLLGIKLDIDYEVVEKTLETLKDIKFDFSVKKFKRDEADIITLDQGLHEISFIRVPLNGRFKYNITAKQFKSPYKQPPILV